MLERVFDGGPRYWGWVLFLLAVLGVGAGTYFYQMITGVEGAGLSRDVAWGFFIANYTFMVGVAASAVMVVLPYYLHNEKDFRAITALGEFLAVAAVLVALVCIIVDIGQPMRLWNMAIHPTPQSPFFWNQIVLPGYLLLNLIIAWFTLDAERAGVKTPPWVKWLILISIPWAISIHTLTAFVYSGISARPFWNTAILAPRFLASAFASGPAALILLALVVRRFTNYDPGTKGIQKLGIIVLYASIINLFFIFVEVMVVLMSGIPAHLEHFQYLYFGLEGHYGLVPWTWLSLLLSVVAILALLMPKIRKNETTLALACGAVFVSMWIDKGLVLVVGGFVPNPLKHITEYAPALPELVIGAGVYALGLLVLTILYKMTVAVKEELVT